MRIRQRRLGGGRAALPLPGCERIKGKDRTMLKRPAGETASIPEDDLAEIDAELVDAQAIDAAETDTAADSLEPSDSEARSWLDADTQAFIVSMMVHVVVILMLAVVPLVSQEVRDEVELRVYPPVDLTEEFSLVEDVAFADAPSTEIGANSTSETEANMALSMAPILAEVSEVVAPALDTPAPNPNFDLDNQLKASVGLVRNDVVVKGMTGVGATGTDGAVDRITYEILRSMEERPTLVVWFFDQSGSLQKRRKEVRDRFDRIYEELGIVSKAKEEAIKQRSNGQEPLLTSIFAFGQNVNLLTKKPTADIDEIRQAIDSVENDPSGVEKVFSAIFLAVDKYKSYRTGRDARNVIFIAVTDERGDDSNVLEATIKECRKFAIPVYVVGVPAPFGREFTYVKYVDPDPKFDQSVQWAQVDQGPESLLPERVKLGYKDDYFEEPVVDSGFGPYALSRLAYETGGIYFTVHANRRFDRRVNKRETGVFESDIEYFFDPEIMVKYRPDYESLEEYKKRVLASPLRQAVVQAARLARVGTLESPTMRFVRRDEAALINGLTQAQQQAARLEPQLASLAQVLQSAENERDKEASPRWLAGYELALGTVLAHKVRAEGYNLMLAKAKRGMKFEDPKNNTWVLHPSDEISVGSKLEKEGKAAVNLLTEVAERHRGTPWGLLASRELERPVGWKWVEEYTDLNPPRPETPGPNGTPRPPQDDKARMLAPPPPKRPIPKL